MRWLDGMMDRMDVTLTKFPELMKDRQACLATIHGVAEAETVEELNNTIGTDHDIFDIKFFGSIPFGIH